MSTKVGSIYYDLDLETKKFDSSSRKVDSKLKTVGSGLVGLGKTMAKTGIVMGALVGGIAIKGGISRSLNIEDAQAKLKGLGHDMKSIETIMDSALGSVKGTAFGLDAAASAAASAVAAGIEPGKDLQRVLSLTGDTATITGRNFNEAGAVINKVLASNRLSMQEVNQLMDAGLPILSMLGEEYGKTAEEMRDMVSSGKVDSKKFLNAIEKNIGGAALASGNTTRGAFENMKAAMFRVGEAMVKDLAPKFKDGINKITGWLDDNQEKIVEWTQKAYDFIKMLSDAVVIAAPYVKDAFILMGKAISGLIDIAKTLYGYFERNILPIIQVIAEFVKTQLVAAWEDIRAEIEKFIEVLKPHTELLKKLAIVIGVVLLTPMILMIAITAALLAALAIGIAVIARVIGWLMKFAGWMWNLWSAVAETVGQIIRFFRDLWNTASEMARNVRGAISGMIDNIKGTLGGLWGTFVDAGWSMMRGLANGIKNAAYAPINAVKNVAAQVRDYMPFSPAKKGPFSGKGWTLYSGQSMMQGLAQGITQKANIPEKAMDGAMQNINKTSTTSVYGNITIGNRADADNFFKRLNLDQDRLGSGLSALETSGV